MAAGRTYTPIAITTLGSAQSSVTFSSISSEFTDLILVCNAKTEDAERSIFVRLNSDSGSNYSATQLYGNGTTATSDRASNSTFAYCGIFTTTNFDISIIHFQNYSNTTTYKTIITRSASASAYAYSSVSLWRNTAAINSIAVAPGGGFPTAGENFVAGSTFTLYGILAA